jgi:hypothetical protein
MAQNAVMMIHSPLTLVWDYSNAVDLRKEADVLDIHEMALMPRYVQCMSLPEDEIKTLLKNETWYTAKTALAAGLIDEIIDAVDLDDVEDQMENTESKWENVVNTFHTPPPNDFVARFCSRAPETKPYFEKIKQQHAKKQEEDEMTDEQLQELKQAFTDNISTATNNLSTKIEKSMKAMQQALEDDIQDKKEQVILINTGFKDLSDNLKKQTVATADDLKAMVDTAKKQSTSQAEAIAGITTTLDDIKKLPVNQKPIPEYGNASVAEEKTTVRY